MKALVYHGDHDIRFEEVEKPTIKESKDVLVKMVKTTICGTDLGIYKGKNQYMKEGTILGHEGVGIVEEVGSAVTLFKKGDKVIISCITSCGTCGNCKKQLYAHCENGGGWILGHLINGTQAEYVRIPYADSSLYKLPDSINEEAALMISDALPTGYEIGVLYGKVKPGDSVVIVGAGPVGMASLLTAQFFSPSQLIVVDMDENRLEYAKSLGATHLINSAKENPVEVIKSITGAGVDVAIEAVGIAATLQLCTLLVNPGGNVANVGVHGSPVELEMENLWIKNINISMGLVSTSTIPQLMKSVASKKIAPEKLITHRFKFDKILDAYAVFMNAAKENAMKISIELN